MGLGGISLWQLLILLLIVVLLFGTKRLRNIGSDLSSAIRDFRKGLSGDESEDREEPERLEADPHEPEPRDTDAKERDGSRESGNT